MKYHASLPKRNRLKAALGSRNYSTEEKVETGKHKKTHNVRTHTLLDFAVILQLLTVKKYSKIPYIWFTVNYCNTHCIMGISV